MRRTEQPPAAAAYPIANYANSIAYPALVQERCWCFIELAGKDGSNTHFPPASHFTAPLQFQHDASFWYSPLCMRSAAQSGPFLKARPSWRIFWRSEWLRG